jgi:hypothetical protein
MPAPIREWRTYYAGQPAMCPGVRLGVAERRRLRELRGIASNPTDRRHGEPPAPELLIRCQAIFVRVGLGWIYRLHWLADPWHQLPSGLVVCTSMCRDCHTIFEVQVDRVSAERTA